MSPVRTVARLFLSTIFVVSGARSVARPTAFVPRAQKVADKVGPLFEKAPDKFPTDPASLVRINGAAQVLAGLMLARGRLTRPAAVVLASTLVPTTLAAHPFWTIKDPIERRHQETHFMKNLGLFGGLLLAATDTQGRPGLAWRASHYAGHSRHALEHGRHNLEHGLHSIGHSGQSLRRAAKTARREAKIAYKAAAAGRKLPS
ncbi:DoxX family protein [Asanoa sp. WMMD1127]|uniref:DoxX family protein n=1 Tax=Asanoa sp. WMMD1127 TaxID=3016107 RepID=UPI002417B35E|nr:DoxX family protein [Asanoa sp. WMMD1127]MDG4822122.1 DoxX family protein [Asanoa sp. WMMD1127]